MNLSIIDGISGATSGFIATLCWYPLETSRILIQVLDLKKEENKHFIHYIMEIVRKEGIIKLYGGMSSALVGSVISYGIYFFSYKFWNIILEKYNLKKGVLYDSMITSFLAATCTAIGSNPIWVLNSRMAQNLNKTNIQMIRHIYKEEGFGGFFKGVLAGIILTVNPIISFMLYELMKEKLGKNKISGINIIIISLISKLIATIFTYPMLTVKTLFQGSENQSNKEILEILLNIFRKDGLGGYYKGIGAKMIQTLINNAIVMLSHEKLRKLILRHYKIT